MYVLEWQTVSALMGGLLWCLFPELRSDEGNKHHNNTWVSAETVCQESIYIIVFLTWHNESINDDKNDYTLSVWLTRLVFVLLMTSQSIANDITMARYCEVIMWIVISNSFDINFMQGGIHDWSC